MSLVRNAASVFATSVVAAPFALLTSVILARLLSAEDLGRYGVIASAATIASLLIQLGWPSAAIYRLRRVGVRPALVTGAGLSSTLVVSGLAVALLLAFESQLLGALLEGAPRRAFRIGVALVPLLTLGRLMVGLARGMDRFDLANRYRVAVAIGTSALLALWLSFGEAVLLEAVTALVCVHAVSTAGLVAAVLRTTGFSLRFSTRELRESLRFGLKSYAQSLAGQIHEQVDVIMLGALLSRADPIAYYVVAAAVTRQLKMVPEAIAAALYPSAASLAPDDAARLAARAARHATFWVALIAAGVMAAAPLVVPWIYGDAFRTSLVPLWILVPGAALLTTHTLLARYFMALDRQQVTVTAQVLSVLLNVALNLWLIPRFGIIGAALASLGSYSFEAALMAVVFCRSSRTRFRDVFLLGSGDWLDYRDRLRSLARRKPAGPR